MQNNLRDERMDELFRAILSLEDLDQCYELFSDLCTVNELLAMKQRFWVARLLKEGYIYSDIVEITGASTATISRVNRCLNYGSGYRLALDNLKKAGILDDESDLEK
jgi:TrpR-related protein YerC/YecD